MFSEILPLNSFCVPLFLFPSRIPIMQILDLLWLHTYYFFLVLFSSISIDYFRWSFPPCHLHKVFSSVLGCLYRFLCGLHFFCFYFVFQFFSLNFANFFLSTSLITALNCLFSNSFEIMERLFMSSSFYVIVWQHFTVLCFFNFLFFLVAACYRSCVYSLFLNDMSFSVPTISRMFTWEKSQSNILLAELCVNWFTLYFFPENTDGRFRLLATQNSFSLLSCLTVKLLLTKVLSLRTLFSSYFPWHSLVKYRVQPLHNSTILWTVLCCSK